MKGYQKAGLWTLAVTGGVGLAVALQGTPAYADELIELSGPDGTRIQVRVEIADTDFLRAKGLMHRTDLGAEAGMLFVWPEPAVVSFWMRNTLIPLDMLFFKDGMLVAVVPQAQPHDETPKGPSDLVDSVLEVNAGFAEARGIKPGWRLERRRD